MTFRRNQNIELNHRYGKHLMGIHRYKEARSYLADAVNIYVELHGKEDPEVIDLLNNLAAVCLQVGYQSYSYVFLFNNNRINKTW